MRRNLTQKKKFQSEIIQFNFHNSNKKIETIFRRRRHKNGANNGWVVGLDLTGRIVAKKKKISGNGCLNGSGSSSSSYMVHIIYENDHSSFSSYIQTDWTVLLVYSKMCMVLSTFCSF